MNYRQKSNSSHQNLLQFHGLMQLLLLIFNDHFCLSFRGGKQICNKRNASKVRRKNRINNLPYNVSPSANNAKHLQVSLARLLGLARNTSYQWLRRFLVWVIILFIMSLKQIPYLPMATTLFRKRR